MAATFLKEVSAYNNSQAGQDMSICNVLATEIAKHLPDGKVKIWHGSPVWFLEGNPIVGYSKQKKGIRLMFWSGADFGEEKLNIKGQKFKDSSIFYNAIEEINVEDLQRWIEKSRDIQWDYKNIVKRKGVLERL
ncbi:DUF1801 domain-containing protein [Sphingobacterium shayense]|uniref:DUF1801 domain-containing protein n=1 Tax=Sphingobacterium shayense TaxID=626343 RepID=UPI0015539B86|nr:DUF1801 domain-containing protein [Sphingobacterium shayense]NQD69544.1 DUF1801 domain-containing protein [Sphingobacterium shayense]